jgi:membrane protein DedA with SNARE-associated domain
VRAARKVNAAEPSAVHRSASRRARPPFEAVVAELRRQAHAGENDTSIVLILVLAVAGTILGDTLSYTLGRWGGTRLEHSRFGPQLRLGREVIGGRARWLIPFYHLNSWTRAVGPFGAGTLRLPLRVWIPLDYLGALLFNTAWVGSGWLLGRFVLTEDGTLEQHPALRIGIAVTAVAWYFLVQRELLRSYRRAGAGDAEAAEARAHGSE